MRTHFRHALLASTVFVGAAAFATPAFAQDDQTTPTTAETTSGGNEIIITGSRIASPTLTSASPLQIVDAKEIDDSGVSNIQEVLLDNPVFGTPALSRANSNFLTSSAGVTTVDLRDLGSDRTLVLVNGRRFVAGVPASATVDLNMIPTQFIERVDVLTGGASSVYGSDAVAGVVNIIYKDDFQGIEGNAQAGIAERGDDSRQQLNLMMGTNFADNRGNITVFLGYSKEGVVRTRDRGDLFQSGKAVDQASLGAFVTGDPNDLFTATAPFRSGFAPQGTFFLKAAPGGITRTFNPCTGAIQTTNTNGADDCATGFNRSFYRTIAVPTTRYLLAMQGHYDISDDVTAFVEGTFGKTSTHSELEPFPAASSGATGIFPASGGRFDIEQNVTIATGLVTPPASCTSYNPVTGSCHVINPYLPAAFYALAADQASTLTGQFPTQPNGLKDIGFQQRLTSFGDRGNDADRDTFRLLGGLEGSVFNDMHWEAYVAYGETVESQVGFGQVNAANFREALNVIPDVADVDGDGNTSEAICANPQARASGCAPANIFGANLLSPEAVKYIIALSTTNTKTSQTLAGINLSGNLFEGWAGPIGFAAGAEYRKEFSKAINDPLTETGGNLGNALPSVRGSFDVKEAYAELAIPLLADAPFAKSLDLRGAARISDYSTVGTVWSWNAGLEWAPIDDIRFRVVRARATRAPNVGELFTPPQQTFPTGLIDPCDGIEAGDTSTVGQNCLADPGVVANIANFGAFTLSQADLQGIGGYIPGNPNLNEEQGNTFTIGAVINPTSIDALRNLVLTIDYFQIKIDDAIQVIPFQNIINECYNNGNAEFCALIERRPGFSGPNNPGSIETINTATTNVGGIKTKGIDTTLTYRFDLSKWGLEGAKLNAHVAYTHYFKGEVEEYGGTINPYVGEVGGTAEDKVTGTLSVDHSLWGVTFRGTWIGPQYLDDQFITQFQDFDTEAFLTPHDKRGRVGSEFYLDMQARFTPGDHFEFYFGVDNMLDNDPPPIITGLPGDITGTETAADVYDVFGRRYYAGARIKF